MNSPVVSNGFRVPVYRIPVFGLYGTAADPQRAGYAHIENISCRAPTNDWTIHAHRHAGLAQCLFVQRGGGTFELEGQIIAFSAPWYAWLPSAVVHGFQFEIGTEGYVLTMSDDMVSSCLGRSIESERLAPLVHEPIHGPVPSDAEIGISVSSVMQSIMREHDLPRSGVNAALQAYLALLLVSFLRKQTISHLDSNLGSSRAADFRRFRAHVEKHFRDNPSIAGIAEALGVTTERLHSITVQAVGKSPLKVIHERLIVECKMELIYTDRPINTIAYEFGFSDPAYFSRFFSRMVGRSPRSFRQSFGRDA